MDLNLTNFSWGAHTVTQQILSTSSSSSWSSSYHYHHQHEFNSNKKRVAQQLAKSCDVCYIWCEGKRQRERENRRRSQASYNNPPSTTTNFYTHNMYTYFFITITHSTTFNVISIQRIQLNSLSNSPTRNSFLLFFSKPYYHHGLYENYENMHVENLYLHIPS